MTEGDWDPCEAVTTSWPPTLVYWVEYTLEPVVPNPLLTLAGVVGHSAVAPKKETVRSQVKIETGDAGRALSITSAR